MKKISVSKLQVLLGISLLAPILTTASIFYVSYMVTAYLPPARALFIAVYFIFTELVIFFVLLTLLFRKKVASGIMQKFSVANSAIFVVSLLLLTNILHKQFKIIKNDVQEYATNWDVEVQNILYQKEMGNPKLTVKYINPVGGLDGLTENGGWVASCLKDYYEFESIEVVK